MNAKSTFRAATYRHLGHAATVDHFYDISPRLRVIRFTGPEVQALTLNPGDKVKLCTSPSSLRSYTPSLVAADGSWFEMVFFRHNGGPGSHWATNVSIGTRCWFLGPKRSMPFSGPAAWHLMLGDESAAGLYQRLQQALGRDAHIFGALEMDAMDVPALSALSLPLEPVLRAPGARGLPLLSWLRRTPLPPGPGAIYLSGHTGSVQILKGFLLDSGCQDSALNIKPYWSEKKRRR